MDGDHVAVLLIQRVLAGLGAERAIQDKGKRFKAAVRRTTAAAVSEDRDGDRQRGNALDCGSYE